MANAHRANVLITSCLKTPVDPHTKAPLALYERERALPYSASHDMDNRDYEKEMEYDDSGSELGDGQPPGKGSPLMTKDYRVTGEHIDLRQFYFSNEEYYRKLEELKRSHLCTMAELENMYRRKLQLKGGVPPGEVEGEHRLPWMKGSPAAVRCLKKSHSALELRRGSGVMDTSDEESAADVNVEKGLLSSPKEHIKNMWQDFKLSPRHLHLSSSSLQSLPGDRKGAKGLKGRKKGRKDAEREPSKPRVTVPKPFHMTVREAEKRRHGVKTRSEIELENADLRRQLEELTECQRQFRASPMPAHVRLRLFEELQERDEARRTTIKEREERRHRAAQRPFSFLERERQKKEQREEQLRQLRSSAKQERVKPFKAKPVPKAVYEAASGEQMKEDQLYRAIKMQMRAKEMLHSASMPPSMLARRLSERKRAKGDGGESEEDNSSPHRPKINTEVPDFDASYRRFRKQLENRRELKPVTTCEPFQLRTSQIASHRERVLEEIEKDQSSPRAKRWPYISPRLTHTPNSSLCSSLSGSLELLPAKVTDAAKKRQEAVRKVLEQRKKAEEEEESWRERQKQREKKLQKMVSKRAQANDPHLALSQTCQTKLKQFRKQDLQRRKEYQEEMKEMQQRVKGRPLLLEQVAQRNAKQAAEKRYTDALHGCGLTEDFVSSKVPVAQRPHSCDSALRASTCSDSNQSDKDLDVPVVYNKVYLDDYPDDEEDLSDHEADTGRTRDKSGSKTGDHDGADHGSDNDHCSDDDHHSQGEYNYSDDDEHYSEDSEHNLSADEKNEESDIVKKCQSRLSNRSGQHSRTSQYSEREESIAKSDKN